MNNKRIPTLLLLVFTFFVFSVEGQQKKNELRVLFVGNSYTYYENLPQLISLISDSLKTKLVTRKSTLGGAKLREHWRGERGLKTRSIIENGKFDIVVLQEYSMGPIDEPDSLVKYMRLFCNLIKERKARPFIYQTWARERVPQYQEQINNVFQKVVTENGATLVPAGKAWALARQKRPTVELFSDDGSHPAPLGAFLTSCVFVRTILGELPRKLSSAYETKDMDNELVVLMYLSDLDVVFCKKIAEEALTMK